MKSLRGGPFFAFSLPGGGGAHSFPPSIGVRKGILLGDGKKLALKITICPENNNLP